MIIPILVGILMLAVFIVIHEFGHYWVARKLGFRIEEFAIGMGPKIYSRRGKKHHTLFSVRIFPIGGFCKFYGEDEALDAPDAFNKQKVWKRMLVIVSGSLANILTALLLAVILVAAYGVVSGMQPVVGRFLENSAAQEAGMQVGDRVVAVNGITVETTEQISGEIKKAVEKQQAGERPAAYEPIVFTVARDGGRIDIPVAPRYVEAQNLIMIGVEWQPEFAKLGFFDTIKYAFRAFGNAVVAIVGFLFGLIFRFENADQVGGVVSVVGEISTLVKDQNYWMFLQGALIISANLGIFNLLPLPALDGGRLVFLLIEGVRGKPVRPEKEGWVHMAGFVLLIGLIIFITYRDIARLIAGG